MNTTLDLQIMLAQQTLGEASAQNQIDRAKFALGLIGGALSVAVPEEDRATVLRTALEGSTASSLESVLDAAVYLLNIANGL